MRNAASVADVQGWVVNKPYRNAHMPVVQFLANEFWHFYSKRVLPLVHRSGHPVNGEVLDTTVFNFQHDYQRTKSI